MFSAICMHDSSGDAIFLKEFRGENTPDCLSMDASCSSHRCLSGEPDGVRVAHGKKYAVISQDSVRIVATLCDSAVYADLVILDILQSIASVLKLYTGTLTCETIKNRFDVVCPILDELLYEGKPFSLNGSQVGSSLCLTGSKSLVSKLSSAVSSTFQSSSLPSFQGASDVWWRSAGVKHGVNELYVDVLERVNCVVSPKGKILSGSVSGSINIVSRLSDVPDILLSFKSRSSTVLRESISFHPCVRVPRWSRDQKLSFTPPDGEFVVADYMILNSSKAVLPLKVQAEISFESSGGTLLVSLVPNLNLLNPDRTTKPLQLENVCVKIRVPRVVGTTTLITQSGQAVYDETTGLVFWTVGSMSSTSALPLRLKGSMAYSGVAAQDVLVAKSFKCSASVEFTVRGWSASGVKVDTVDINNVDYKPYKGCRYSTSNGRIDIRL